jgi:hypothetical protein
MEQVGGCGVGHEAHAESLESYLQQQTRQKPDPSVLDRRQIDRPCNRAALWPSPRQACEPMISSTYQSNEQNRAALFVKNSSHDPARCDKSTLHR